MAVGLDNVGGLGESEPTQKIQLMIAIEENLS